MISLLLITLEGQTYGIREEEVRQIEELPSLHRLPFSPGCIAGMAIRDGRTVTLADLAVCIGHGPVNQTSGKRLLLVPQEGLIKGFVVGGQIGRAEVAPESIFPIPFYLRTDTVDRCALIDSLPVPLINLLRLHDRLQNNADEAAAASFTLPAAPVVLSEVGSYRIFVAGGELFAVPSELAETDAAKEPGPIAAVRPLPKFVRGLTWHRNSLIPVFDLAQRLHLHHGQDKDLVLAGAVEGAGLGLLVEEDRGVVPSGRVALHQLPPIAAASWFRAAVVLDGKVIPILDLSELFSIGAEGEREVSPSTDYTVDASFRTRFGKEDIEVTEFSLLGMRHAVPRSERDAILGFRPFRPIPGTLPIVAGIAEYEGMLLPVIDLATVFGRRSLPTSEWSMMVLQNGDFRALVLAENVYGDRRLGRDLQRAVPIALPHNVVYGCYLETDAVRLILNVHAMAVHFEAFLVEELLPVFSKQMEQLPAVLVSAETEEPRKLAPAAGTVREEGEVEGAVSVSVPPLDDSAKVPAPEPVSVPGVEEPQAAALVSAAQEAETTAKQAHEDSAAEMESPSLSPESAGENGLTNSTADSHDVHTAELTAVRETELQPLPQETAEEIDSTQISATTPREREEMAASEASGPALTAETFTDAAQAREESGNADQAVMKDDVAAKDGVMTGAVVSEYAPAPEPSPVSQELPVPGALPPEQEKKVQPPSTSFEPVRLAEKQKSVPLPPLESRRRVRWFHYAALVLLVLAVIGVFRRTDRQQTVPTPPASAPSAAKTHVSTSEKKETLVLEVPGDMAIENEVYIVRPGDTLWHISGRFTGNPKNYPHIAGDNRIANPDLIFPDQQIRLKRQDIYLKSTTETTGRQR